MRVELRSVHFEPYAELLRHQAMLQQRGVSFGATASFVGTMRDFNEGDPVRKMVLEHYPGMTERHLELIVETARRRWKFLDALVIHRTGEVEPGDPIVLVAVWTAHRGAAFDACREMIEALKSEAPLWKKETLDDGERWVEKNTSGY
ncbi:MAG: molybdenum cofactor biosynthesis protein MoaE [Methylotetracoccus sp.]|nr:molybdenum cofactor biosynthesis protein MoaE [Methylotetracoccus sp.]